MTSHAHTHTHTHTYNVHTHTRFIPQHSQSHIIHKRTHTRTHTRTCTHTHMNTCMHTHRLIMVQIKTGRQVDRQWHRQRQKCMRTHACTVTQTCLWHTQVGHTHTHTHTHARVYSMYTPPPPHPHPTYTQHMHTLGFSCFMLVTTVLSNRFFPLSPQLIWRQLRRLTWPGRSETGYVWG